MKIWSLPKHEHLTTGKKYCGKEAVLTSTHNLCFEQDYEKYQNLLSENFPFLVAKFSIYLNRHVFVMVLLIQPVNISVIVRLFSAAIHFFKGNVYTQNN